jgi:hypothetical protein
VEFEIKAGGKLDLLTQREAHAAFKGALKDWMVEAYKGARPVKFAGAGTIANGAVQIGGSDGIGATTSNLGPAAGMVWSVKRLAVRGISSGSETLSLYTNTASPFDLVRDGVTGFERFGSDELILIGPEKLLFAGTNLVSTGTVTVSGQAMELPIGMLWKLV